jgi:hypothetical protein
MELDQPDQQLVEGPVDVQLTLQRAKESERSRDLDSAVAFYSQAIECMRQERGAEYHPDMAEALADYG